MPMEHSQQLHAPYKLDVHTHRPPPKYSHYRCPEGKISNSTDQIANMNKHHSLSFFLYMLSLRSLPVETLDDVKPQLKQTSLRYITDDRPEAM